MYDDRGGAEMGCSFLTKYRILIGHVSGPSFFSPIQDRFFSEFSAYNLTSVSGQWREYCQWYRRCHGSRTMYCWDQSSNCLVSV